MRLLLAPFLRCSCHHSSIIELLHSVNHSDTGYLEVIEGEIDDETLSGFDKYVIRKKMCNIEPFSPACPGKHEQVVVDEMLQLHGGGS
jgi:hypothetical protein